MKISSIIFFIILLASSVYSQTEPEPYEFEFQCDCPHELNSYPNNVQLNHVQFHDHLPMIYDDRSPIPEIQYYSSRNRYPVAYESSQKAKVSAMFTSTCSHPLYIYGRTANQNNVNFYFPVRYVTPTGAGDYYYPISEATEEFEDDLVNAFVYGGGFTVEWFVSPDPITSFPPSGGQIIGTSNNALYVTHDDPEISAQGGHQVNDTELFLSTIGNSCLAAKGVSDEDGIVDAIYAKFQTRYIQRISDTGGSTGLLRYWTDPGMAESCSSTYDLYGSQVGRSFNYAELMTDMIKTQGIHHSVILRITYENESVDAIKDDLRSDLSSSFFSQSFTTYISPSPDLVDPVAGPIPFGSLWEGNMPGIVPFFVPPVSPIVTGVTLGLMGAFGAQITILAADPLSELEENVEPSTYLYIKNQLPANENNKFHLDKDATVNTFAVVNGYSPVISKLTEQDGLLAQGEVWQALESDNKPKKLSRLYLVEHEGRYYDPSYATEIFGSVAEWESHTISRYGLTINNVPLTISLSPENIVSHNLHYAHQVEDNSTQDTTVD